MKYIKIFILVLSFTSLLFSEVDTVELMDPDLIADEEAAERASYEPPLCYTFKKEGFDQTLKIPKDVIIAVNANAGTDEIYGVDVRMALSKELPDISSYPKGNFYCDTDKSGHYECIDSNAIGRMHVYLKNESMYLHVDYTQLSSDNEALIHHIKSKKNTFIKGVKSPCYLSMETKISVENVKKGSKKDKLLQSINIRDVIVYDLAYHGDLVIALGGDNSPENRDKYYYTNNEGDYAYSVILKSVDGGLNWSKKEFKDTYPANKVLILNKKKISISSELGDYVGISFNEGESWVYSDLIVK